jgi:anti-sigma regulatory factor (Ser/Thr protein kinase)
MEIAMSNLSTTAWRPARGGPTSTRIVCDDESRVGEARRAAEAIARSCGLGEGARGTLAIVVTEAATNLARHAREGVVLLRDTSSSGVTGVELLAIDSGPGMEDLERFFTDGFSTGGTAGAGLGAMRRQADLLDVYSLPGKGTVVLARVFAGGAETRPARLLDVGVVCLPLDGETACGDGWCVRQDADHATVLLVDGLGHGPNAADAADAAITAFQSAEDRAPKEIIALLHEALRSTRGAAVAVAEVRRTSDGATIDFCGVGNTVTAVIGQAGPRSLPSMNGTAGLTVRALQPFTQPWYPGEMLVMHTDGLTTRWRLDAYPGVRAHDPAIAAAVLHRDASRGRDDATVLAFGLREAAGT